MSAVDRIVVVSTERDAGQAAADCILSVAHQVEEHAHVFVDAGSGPETRRWLYYHAAHAAGIDLRVQSLEKAKPCAQNLYEVIHELEPSAIVCWVDGDDRLAHPAVLSVVRQKYEADPDLWMTWGQFQYADRRPGWASDYPAEVKLLGGFRNDIWRATHLKTFRAGLFQMIKRKDLFRWKPDAPEPEWIVHAVDLAIMFPMLEMARDHGKFVPLTLYTYSGENGAHYAPGNEAWNEAIRVRAMPRYPRLEERPW